MRKFLMLSSIFALSLAFAGNNNSTAASDVSNLKSSWSSLTGPEKKAALAKAKNEVQERSVSSRQNINRQGNRSDIAEGRKDNVERRKADIKAELAKLTPAQKDSLKTKYAQHKAVKSNSDDKMHFIK